MQGRDRERAALATLLDRARSSRGGALVLRGLPGVGKSTLLAEVADGAEGFRVLRTRGIESESPLAFAALHRLLRPVLRHADALPAPQAAALRAAFGEAEGPGSDRFLVFLAALSLLAEAAERTPVLGVVDDAHWLDDASAAALLFVARRLEAEPVALLFGARDGDIRQFEAEDLPQLELAAFGAEAAGQLVSARAGVEVPPGVAERLVAGTGGIPLALAELSDVLTEAQLSGSAPLPVHLPLTEGVERAFLDRYRRLPEPARAFLLVAAADDSGRLAVVQHAAAHLGADEDALDAVERSGLLKVRGADVELRHPLVRSAVYGAATSAQRRRVHSALAGSMPGADNADRRAWHLAASTAEPDAAVVAELVGAAERAARRGGHEAACAAWERAAELSPDDEQRAAYLYAAARGAWLSGQAARARALADAALAEAHDPGLRADVARLRARVEWNAGSVQLAHRMILRAAREVAPFDQHRALEMGMFAAALASFRGSSDVDVRPTDLAPVPTETDPPRTQAFGYLLHGLDAVADGDWPSAVPLLRAAFEVPVDLDASDQDLLPNLGIAATHLGDDEAGLRYHGRLLTRARDTGAVVMILYSLTRRAWTDVPCGRWATASAGASEALALARGTGQPGLTGLPLAWLTLLAALRGEESYGALLGEVEPVIERAPMGIVSAAVTDLVRWARAVEAYAHPATAFHHLQQISHHIARNMAAVDRIEAAVRAGERETALAWVDELADFADATGAEWAAATVEHGRALLADAAEAAGHFERSLKLHAAASRPYDRARAELAYGEHLRRTRRRVDARTHLRSALETFDDLGAARWAERARQELRASGETARRRDASAAGELTPQEVQVARLVATGLPNREVAAQLFLSPRTIDFHLRNVFAKLGVTSRAELAALPLRD